MELQIVMAVVALSSRWVDRVRQLNVQTVLQRRDENRLAGRRHTKKSVVLTEQSPCRTTGACVDLCIWSGCNGTSLIYIRASGRTGVGKLRYSTLSKSKSCRCVDKGVGLSSAGGKIGLWL